jgi:hypothetical protein
VNGDLEVCDWTDAQSASRTSSLSAASMKTKVSGCADARHAVDWGTERRLGLMGSESQTHETLPLASFPWMDGALSASGDANFLSDVRAQSWTTARFGLAGWMAWRCCWRGRRLS